VSLHGRRGRGTVWEEIIVSAPKDVALVALSATVANVKEIADWISIVHRPIVPIFHPHRPVPPLVRDRRPGRRDPRPPDVRAGRARVIGDEPRGRDDRGRWYTRRVVQPTILIDALAARGWLPTIYFIFSRAGCERAMQDVLTEGRSLLAPPQQREVDTAIGDLLRESPTVGESALNQSVFEALRMGIGLHHAGILPSLKRLIELLFERGLCRVVFATETMSLGIHMPARSVVLQGLTKRTDRGFRALTHNELTQNGRPAGRRGIDPEGTCVVRSTRATGSRTCCACSMARRSRSRASSSSLRVRGAPAGTGAPPEALRRRIESSFGQYQNLKRIRAMEAGRRRAPGIARRSCAATKRLRDFQRIGAIGGRVRRSRHGARRWAVVPGAAERTAAEAEPGRLILVRRGGAPALAMVLGVHSIRSHRVLIEALLPHGPPCA